MTGFIFVCVVAAPKCERVLRPIKPDEQMEGGEMAPVMVSPGQLVQLSAQPSPQPGLLVSINHNVVASLQPPMVVSLPQMTPGSQAQAAPQSGNLSSPIAVTTTATSSSLMSPTPVVPTQISPLQPMSPDTPTRMMSPTVAVGKSSSPTSAQQFYGQSEGILDLSMKKSLNVVSPGSGEGADVPEQDEPIDFSLKHSEISEEGSKSPVAFRWHTPLVSQVPEAQESEEAEDMDAASEVNQISDNINKIEEQSKASSPVVVRSGFVLGEVVEYISKKESLEESDEEQSLKQAAAALMDMSNLNMTTPPSTPPSSRRTASPPIIFSRYEH